MFGTVVGHEVVTLALRARRFFLEWMRGIARDRHEVDRATGEDAEVHAGPEADRGVLALLIRLTRRLVLKLLPFGLSQERL